MKKRTLSMILVISVLLTLLFPLTASAQESPMPEEHTSMEAAGSSEGISGESAGERTDAGLTEGAPAEAGQEIPEEAPPETSAPQDSSGSIGNPRQDEPSPNTAITAKAPFTITLNPMGGLPGAETVQTDERGFLPEIPFAEKEQFFLLGWTQEETVLPENFTYGDVESLSLITEETQFTGNATIYAVWIPMVEIQSLSLDGPWDGTSAAEPTSIGGVYQIGTPQELAWFRNTVNAGSNQINAMLTADIDLNNMEWVPIGGGDGYATTYFGGSFDGAGYSITGLSVNATFNFAGLFGYINDPAAVVKNLSVGGAVTSTSTNVGGIAGALAKGTILNCSFSGSVTNIKASSGYAGGIVGYFNNSSAANNPTVRGCVNNGAVSGPYAGGIAGYGKYGAILECYNTGDISGKTRAGGIAGQMQNNFNCSYCYSVGALSGSSTAAEITDFLYASATLSHCGYQANLSGTGTGTTNDCFQFSTPAELLAGLGSAYKANGDGWPVLGWQAGGGGTEPTPDPKVTLSGATAIFVEQGVTPNQTTVTLALQDIREEDITNISWETTVLKGSIPLEEMVAVSHPENNNNAIILAALTGGGVIRVEVAVTAGGETYTDARDVSVIPQITYAEVVNADPAHGVYPVLGELATVKIYTLGGSLYDFDNYPELNFKWRYNSSGAADIPGATGKDYLIPGDGSFEAGKYVYVEILSGTKVLRSAMDTRGLLAAKAYTPDMEEVDNAASIFDDDYGPLRPVYGTDTNILDMVNADLAKAGFGDIAVTIKSMEEIYGGGSIHQDGSLEFFYADPNSLPTVKMSQYKVTLNLEKGDASKEVRDLVVNIPWDGEKVRTAMRDEILPGVTEDTILGTNDKDNIVSDLVLPKVVDDKKWVQVSWTSSDPAVVSISDENQRTPETLFDPYVGKVIRGENAKTVTLTARFNFQFTSAPEPDIILYKTFTFKIPPLSSEEVDALRGELLEKIDAGVASTGFSDYVTKQRLVAADGVYTVYNDIQYPTTRNFGVDGKYFPVTISSANEDIIESPDVANAARSFVYRPLPGNPAGEVEVTITITDSAKGVSASREYKFMVEPLTQEEIDSALSLMTLVKDNYFEGLNNSAYDDYYSVTGKLTPFQEAALSTAENGGSIQWIYTDAERTNDGIIADEIDGWADQEAWRAFRSSDPAVLDHETLNFTKPEEDTFVRISSSLTHSIFGKYWLKFKGTAGYEAFEPLYRQPVCEYVMAEGVNHVERTPEELTGLRAQAITDINAPISATLVLADFEADSQPAARSARAALFTKAGGSLINATVSNLEAGTTVFGLFRKVMAEHNYTYSSVGSYIRSITDPHGNTLAERDGGPNSGWIYTVNGAMLLVYMNGYTLKQGDVVAIKYTRDYTKEPGAVFPENPSTPSKPTKPENPSTPTNPINPTKPANPTNPARPANPADPMNPADPDGSGTSPEVNAGSTGNHSNQGSKGNGSGLDPAGGDALTTGASPAPDANGSGGSANADADIGHSESGQAPDSEGFDDTYVEKNAEENKDSQDPTMMIVLVAVIAAFLVISGVVYSRVIKKRKK